MSQVAYYVSDTTACEYPASGYSRHDYVPAEETVHTAFVLMHQSAAQANAVYRGSCEAYHCSTPSTHSVLEQLRAESSCRSTLSLTSEGSSNEDSLHRVPTPHQDGFTSPVGYSWLLTAGANNSYLDPIYWTRIRPTTNSAIPSQCYLKRLTLFLISFEVDTPRDSNSSWLTCDDELWDEDYAPEYLLTPSSGDASAEAGWRSEVWRVSESTLGDNSNDADTF